jgi:hypothetical protein
MAILPPPLGLQFVKKAFNPSNIAGLQLWLDATTGLFDATSGGNPVTTDGGSVARWEDQSGSGRHITQATSGDRPILKTSIQNSKNILRFDGSSQYLSRTDAFVFNAGATTIFCAIKSSAFVDKRLIAEGNSANSLPVYAPMQSSQLDGTRVSHFYRTDAGSIVLLNQENGGTAFNGSFNLVQISDTGSQFKFFVNKTETKLVNYTRATTTLDRFSIGCLLRASPGFFIACDLGEVIIYDSAISTSNKQLVENYLYSKWGIV